ncbi:hypothetical protein GCM10010300_52470 [Streptomyces olivaceoviridis]|nr:hypothetical protein GCM10010300_52470 [Streptomyces olivaceoviridis]
MRRSDVVPFWIPREMHGLPGLVSNVKWGAWYDSGRAVSGAPPEAERMAYLLHFAEEFGVPVERALPGAAEAALRAVGRGSHRTGGGRAVPLGGVTVRALPAVVRGPPCGLPAAGRARGVVRAGRGTGERVGLAADRDVRAGRRGRPGRVPPAVGS